MTPSARERAVRLARLRRRLLIDARREERREASTPVPRLPAEPPQR